MTLDRNPPAFPMRDGYRLIGAVPVAIPISRVDLSILVEEVSQILDSSRYLLAFIEEGIDRVDTLGQLMGLKPGLMETIVSQAYHSGFVFPLADGTISITNLGRAALHDAKQLVVSSQSVELGIDRMTGEAFGWTDVPYDLKATQAQLNRMAAEDEISPLPHPARPPTLDELMDPKAGTRAVVAELLRGSKQPRRLVEAVAIEGKVNRLYRIDAHALRVVPIEGGQREWDFIVSGRLSEDHAQAFLKSQSTRRRVLLPEPPPHPLEEFDLDLDSEEINRLDTLARVKLEERQQLTQRKQDLTTRSETAPNDMDTSHLQTAIADITRQLTDASFHEPDELPEVLDVHDHRPFLLSQLDQAQYRVLIVSPWVRGHVFNTEVESAIRRALSRGVHVSIRYGYEGQGVSSSVGSRLDQLATAYSNFDHRDLGNSHSKIFAVDDKFVTSGSFNWLSFLGSPDRTYRDETTFVISNRSIIDVRFAKYLDDATFADTRPPEAEEIPPEVKAVVFVEGWSDLRFLEMTSAAARRPDLLEGIDIRFERGGAKGAAGSAIAFTRNHPDIPTIALFDSDEIGRTAAKHVKEYAAGGANVVMSYGDVYPAHRSDVEAEHLFPAPLVQRFVDENGGRLVYDAARKVKKTDEMIYDINKESKELFVDWIESQLTEDDTQLWIELLESIRTRLGLGGG